MFKLVRLTDTTKLVQVAEMDAPITIQCAINTCLAGNIVECL